MVTLRWSSYTWRAAQEVEDTRKQAKSAGAFRTDQAWFPEVRRANKEGETFAVVLPAREEPKRVRGCCWEMVWAASEQDWHHHPAKVIHSFRHTVVTRLTAAGAPQDMREVIVGHAAENVHGQTYVHREGIPLALLKEHLEKLAFPGLVSS